MTVLLLDDDDVRAHLDAPTAVRAVREALLAAHHGTLTAPPRVHAGLEDGDGGGELVFTAGHLRDRGVFGFRAYDTLVDVEQLVAVWGSGDGRLRAVVHGSELGPRRTGAIGAVAVDAAARPGPVRIGLVGAGPQAWTQLWALRAVREVADAVVVARRPERAAAFARRAAAELGVAVRAVAAVEDAVRDRDVVIVATGSPVPVLEAGWLAPGTHLSTLGPKSAGQYEVPPEVAERARTVLTDSPAQSAALPGPPLFPAGRLTGLGAVLAGAAPARSHPDDLTVFSSVGLAGTEIAVAAALCDAMGR
ncbi:ornithine cyclodeaminase [Streptomyces sp. NRRL F-4489]|uniref:NAD(P)-binding domain-containing protein n=1 Tax=Streptomyces sp. NRRL F-4489 TaxID=1609095 RepID=UPI0007493A17|nr:NAD(P)-binding domain-containing protein [Streptomyces sp. NRRL F-4489]KUL34831.1 ornithine cyclodeaminase [Streptomyces sp. NRRL F-4489]